MLMHETCESKTHYGAVLHHPELHTPHLALVFAGAGFLSSSSSHLSLHALNRSTSSLAVTLTVGSAGVDSYHGRAYGTVYHS